MLSAGILVGRFVTLEGIANAVRFLASDGAKFVKGVRLDMNGGV